MGLTLTNLNRNVTGNRRVSTVTAQFDSVYPTGGESLTPNWLGQDQREDHRVLRCHRWHDQHTCFHRHGPRGHGRCHH
jgi:hypothetical protein